MKKKEKLIPETESVIPEAEPVMDFAPEAFAAEPAVEAEALPTAPAVEAQPETVAVEPAPAVEEVAAPVAEAESVEPAPAVTEEAPKAEAAVSESAEESTEEVAEETLSKPGKVKREKAPKQPKQPKERKPRKSHKGLWISLIAVVLAAGIAVGGYFLGLLDFIFNNQVSAKKYLVLAKPQKEFSQVTRVDAEVIDEDWQNDLLLLKEEELTPSNRKGVTITLYDAKENEELTYWTYTYDLDSETAREPQWSLDAGNYPLVAVVEEHCVEVDYNWEYEYYYHTGLVKEVGSEEFAKEGTDRYWSPILSDEKGVESVETLVNGMIVVTNENTVSYYDKTGKHLRDENRLFVDTYWQTVEYDAEYKGTLYAWSFDEAGVDRKVQLYGTNGICYAEYTHAATAGGASVFVLNNGNVFIQEMRLTEGNDYDYEDQGLRLQFVEMIMDRNTGAITELDLDFVVTDLISAYGGESGDFAFELKNGKNNQAMISHVSKTGVSTVTEYVVLDDEMNVLYSFGKEDSYSYYYGVNEKYYAKVSYAGYAYSATVCNAKGEELFVIPANEMEITDRFIVTTTAIFNLEGKKLYTFDQGAQTAGVEIDVWAEGSLLFMEKKNQVTGKYETYLFNEKKKDFVLIADEIDTAFKTSTTNYYVIYDMNLRVYSLYNAKGEIVLKTQYAMSPSAMEEALYVETTVDGKPVTYVITDKNA